MANIRIENGYLDIELSVLDALLAFHGSFHIPLEHVTNAYVSSFEDLRLQWRLLGTGLGYIKEAGIFSTPEGIIFCDISGATDCVVIETRGERFPRIAVQPPKGQDPSALAHQIVQNVPDGGPVET
jgi:hypothetical protein